MIKCAWNMFAASPPKLGSTSSGILWTPAQWMPKFCIVRLQQGKPKRSMLILTFDLRLQWDWQLDFYQDKGRQKAHCTLGLWQLQIKTMKMSTRAQRRKRDVDGTVCSKSGKKLYMGVTFAMYTCVKVDVILPTIINNIKLLINFFYFWNLPWYLSKTFHKHS